MVTYAELTPQELLAAGHAAPEVNDEPWLVRWDRADADPESLVHGLLPAAVEFHTSGSTGPRQRWRRTREQLWSEAGLLAALLAPQRPQAILSFAPPRHLYGALATLLVPARMRLPVWYLQRFFCLMPPAGHPRWAVVAVPWTFSILRRQTAWTRSAERLAVLHSTATLPRAAAHLVAEAGPDCVRITEVFGSTEAGGIARRSWRHQEPPWELFDDVELARAAPQEDAAGPDGREIPLAVRSPRLAARPGQPPPEVFRTDDFVRRAGDRRFHLTGRRCRLVKINGRRVDLDEVERSLRPLIACADLACVPVPHELSGEHLDLLVVPPAGGSVDTRQVRAASMAGFGLRPRRVRVVDRIDRSETGKLRHIQPPLPADDDADPPDAGTPRDR
ncbi:hypothetical protein [Streptomyces sp. 6N223]|uniref:hypothetical protein n=1 Tax=Streptomyces sp. 6N223 TaxID=3457412 RepID=UPI003FD0C5D7